MSHGPHLFAAVVLAAALNCPPVAAKEKKDPGVNATIKLYEENKGRRKSEQKLNLACKTERGDLVAPATFTYTVDPADACEVSPASGTESKTGKVEFTFKYKKPGECKITFKCSDNEKKVVVKVVSIEKPKAVFTEHDEDDGTDSKSKSNSKAKLEDHSEKTLRMIETQNAMVAVYLDAVGQPDIPGAADPYLIQLMNLLAAVELMEPLEQADVGAAKLELDRMLGAPILLPEMFPDTELLLDLYDTASTRYFQSMDCNGNGSPDFADLENGVSTDLNADFVPDDCNCRAVIFDADDDDDVDQSDFGAFQTCITGPGAPADLFNRLPLTCRCMDVAGTADGEPDGAIDSSDFRFFVACLTGPAVNTAALAPRCDGW